MSSYRIIVDADGGDNAPLAPVKGAVKAKKESPDLDITLLGDEEKIKEIIVSCGGSPDDFTVIGCTEHIEMAETPTAAIQKKKDSSIVKGMMMLRHGEGDAFVSAGSTGAVLVGGQVLVGRQKGLERPPLAAVIPTGRGFSLLLDCGANVDAKATWLVQFARLGTIYMKFFMGVEDPTCGIVNIGAEEEKGNALVKETFPLLKECKDIRFVGSVEARDIPKGEVDVIVTDAFSGNLILKMYEGTGSLLLGTVKKGLMSTLPGKIGGLLAKNTLKKTLKAFDAKAYGGAPLLGLKGLVVKAHGSSTDVEMTHAILQCGTFCRNNVTDRIAEALKKEE